MGRPSKNPAITAPPGSGFDAQNTVSLTSHARKILFRLRTDFEYYALKILKIKNKAAVVVPFRMNRAQRYIHDAIETQRSEKGWVRILLLKSRQQGGSTYVEGRFFWRTTLNRGLQAFIMTHEDKATKNLFGMAKRFHKHTPERLRPHTRADNANELTFDRIESSYGVATAGSKGTGRSFTAQLFHGSEVAFWQHAKEHMAGIGQTIPLLPGTEVILESTANGTANVFHDMVQKALAGKSDYRVVFTPWFWSDEYRRDDVPADFRLTDDEREYADTYDLDDGQMYWRRIKIADDFSDDVSLFAQEYPANIAEAFLGGTAKSLIKPIWVDQMRKPKPHLEIDTKRIPRILSCDPAEYGDDKTAIGGRQGRRIEKVERFAKQGQMATAGVLSVRLKKARDEGNPYDACVIDCSGGWGGGIADRLGELDQVTPIIRLNFGERASDRDAYVIKRDEIWGEMAKEFEEHYDEIELPADDDLLAKDLCAPEYTHDSSRRLKLETKEHMKDVRGLDSPDSGDMLAMTYAYSWEKLQPEPATNASRGRRGWNMT